MVLERVDALDARDAVAIRAELTALLATPTFQRSPALSRLLEFLIERDLAGEAGSLKESVIGKALHGRPADYDPKVDAVVRVNATRLRLRLEEHYRELEAAGKPTGPVRIELRKGSYVPLYIVGGEISSAEDADPLDSPNRPEAWPLAPPALAAQGQSHFWRWVAAAAVLLLIMLTGLQMRRNHAQVRIAEAQQPLWHSRPFARTGGSQQFAAFSPNGRTVAFVSSERESKWKNLYVQDVGSDTARRVTSEAEDDSRPAWSPDGRQLAFLRLTPGGGRQVLTVPAAGGQASVAGTLEGDSPWLCRLAKLSWSRDSRTIYSSGRMGESMTCGLMALDLASHSVRRLTEAPHGSVGDLEAAVSPDGRSIAFIRYWNGMVGDVFVAGLDGVTRQVTQDHRTVLGFAWSDDGQSLLLSSDRQDGQSRLWRVPLGAGTPAMVADLGQASYFPAASLQGKSLMLTQFDKVSDLWRYTPGERAVLVVGNGGVNGTPAVSPDGKKLIYNSSQAGNYGLWVSDADGRGAKQFLKSDWKLVPSSAQWSPDGQTVAFECSQQGNSNICLVDATGADVRELTQTKSNQILPTWARDGKSVYFTSDVTGRCEIFRQALTGGGALQMTHGGGLRAVESPDGKWLYVHRGPMGPGLVRLPTAGPTSAILAAESRPFLEEQLGKDRASDWQPTNDGAIFLAPGKEAQLSELRRFRFRDAAVTDLGSMEAYTAGGVQGFSMTPDERAFYYRRQTSSTELKLLERVE